MFRYFSKPNKMEILKHQNKIKMKINFKKLGTVAAVAALIAGPTSDLISNSGSAPTGRTGSTGDSGNTCAACHSSFGAAVPVEDVILTDIPVDGYTPGETYTITLAVPPNGLATKYGFSLTAEDGTNARVGTFTAGTNSIENSGYVGHNPAQSTATPTWVFTWTAPAEGTGTVTFYGAAVAADGTGNPVGDAVVSSTEVFSENVSSSINTISSSDVDAYIFNNTLNIQADQLSNIESLTIFNEIGQAVIVKNNISFNQAIDVSNLKKGIYFVNITSQSGIITKKVVK